MSFVKPKPYLFYPSDIVVLELCYNSNQIRITTQTQTYALSFTSEHELEYAFKNLEKLVS